MSEHLTREQVAALLDSPDGVEGALAHIEDCEACAREYEQMSRMRMALSALPDLEAPVGQWRAIERRLPRPARRPGIGSPRATRFMQAAAVLMLFAGGLAIGVRLNMASDDGDSDLATADVSVSQPVPGGQVGDYGWAMQELEAVAAELSADENWTDGPGDNLERIAQFDALLAASNEALSGAPADPLLNDFVFDVAAEREDLANRLDQQLRTVSVEY